WLECPMASQFASRRDGAHTRAPLLPGRASRFLGWLPRWGRRPRARRARPWFFAALVALTVGVGTWGFERLPLHPPLSFGQSLYHGFKLLTLDLGPAGGGGRVGLNWQLVAGLLLAAALVVRALFAVLGNRLQQWTIRHFLSGHVIVCGAGVHGSRFAELLQHVPEVTSHLAGEHDVVLIDPDPRAPGLEGPLGPHEWRHVGNAVQPETLVAAGARRAHWIVAVAGDAYVSSQIVGSIQALDGLRDCLHVLVQVEDPAVARFLEEEDLGPPGGPNAPEDGPRLDGERPDVVVTPFSPDAIAADVLVHEARARERDGETALLRMRNGNAPHLVLGGDHPLLDAIVLAALRRWRVRTLRDVEQGSPDRRPPIRISVYGRGAVERVDRLRTRWNPEAHVMDLEAKDAEPGRAPTVEDDDWLRDRRRADHAFVVCEDELEGVGLTLGMSRALGGDVLMTRVTTQPKSVLDDRLQRRTARRSELATTRVEAISDLASNPEEIGIDARERLVRALERPTGPLTAQRAAAEEAADGFLGSGRRVYSDATWRVPPGELALLRALLAPIPLSAMVRARLAVDLEESDNLWTAAEALAEEGNVVDAFGGWCAYVRRLRAESDDAWVARLPPRSTHELGDAVLELARAAADAGGAGTGIPPGPAGGNRGIVIFAGGAASMTTTTRDALRPLLERALRDYDGLVFSGGTAVGLPGLVGEVGRELSLHTVGYAPEGRGDPDLYDTLFETAGSHEFSVREPLSMWSSILGARIPVSDVCLVACEGGGITRAEVGLARALGARVAWLDPANEAETPLADALPLGTDGVLELPDDAMTLRAFIRRMRAPAEIREPLAMYIHSAYRRRHRRRKAAGDAALASWDRLPASLRRSNLDQADDVPNKLAVVGMRLAGPHEAHSSLELADDQVELLAEMEHGRYNLERLRGGWELGERRVSRLATPYLRPWEDLDDRTKDWDREAVRDIAPALESLGWGVAER
ncbi:MAG: hypothetical protein QOI80_514, partial [Solirubrobacteraceae bacterium]|nr:hypothetical protein [Solirubrobacteraceae bacterium]